MKHLLFWLILFSTATAARGLTTAGIDSIELPRSTYAGSLRYWFDTADNLAQTTHQLSGTLSLDVASLASGAHTLHCQLIDTEGAVTAAYSSIFLKMDAISTTAASQLRYWFDDASTVYTANIASGMQVLDVSQLSDGFHHIHYAIENEDGSISPTSTRYFMVEPNRRTGLQAAKLCYMIDDMTEVYTQEGIVSDSLYQYEVDISGLSGGSHTLTCWLTDDYGMTTIWQSAIFDKINAPIVLERDSILTASDRFPKDYSLIISPSASLTILGTDGMSPNTVSLNQHLPTDSYAQILSATSQIVVSGDLSERIYTQGMTRNFLSLPFDCDLSRLTTENGSAYAIRYYDGAGRAANGVGNNWKNYNVRRDIIPMGTGFIYMTEHDAWTKFYAVDNENKNHVFQSTSSATTLSMEKHEAATSQDRGWNLLGNPYANYYSIHTMDFDKPVTYWNGNTYDVCFPNDDDLALKPNQAFFVQCPSDVESIMMPGSGRQLTSEISSGAKARRVAMNKGKSRKLINLSLSDSEFTDKTRVVLNEEASMDYELDYDASKFMSMRPEVPQLYSLGINGTRYAVNERPMNDGTVKLGLYIPTDGNYTLTMTRNDAEQILLTDSETGQTVDLTDGSYSFFAKKGTYNNRLMLTFGTVTGMYNLPSTMYNLPYGEEYFDLSGRRISKPTKAGVYLLKQGKTVQKVWVK